MRRKAARKTYFLMMPLLELSPTIHDAWNQHGLPVLVGDNTNAIKLR
jgi:hypothetical protein